MVTWGAGDRKSGTEGTPPVHKRSFQLLRYPGWLVGAWISAGSDAVVRGVSHFSRTVPVLLTLTFLGLSLAPFTCHSAGDESAAPTQSPGPESSEATTGTDPGSPDARRTRYLELVLDQLWRLEGAIGGLGPSRDAAGLLAAAALAGTPPAEGGREAVRGRSTASEAVRHAEALLEDCDDRWHRGDCPRAQIPLQRALLQYGEVFPPELRERLRRAASVGAPVPPPEEIADPWSFRDTENQRAVRMARSLVGQVVAGTPGSENARGWMRFIEAFLLAHERDGWYEAESPGYLPISMEALLLLADHAPDSEAGERVRDLATRQLHLLFAEWAQNQVRGYPAGAKSRAYVHWALSEANVPWRAWAWLIVGMGDPKDVTFRDWADLAATSRYRVPEAVARLLAGRRTEPPYEIHERRRIEPARRVHLDAAFSTWATPDYVLGCAQAVDGLRLRVSGSHRIVATLYVEGDAFAPVYLWSRTENPRGKGRDVSGDWTGDDLATCEGNTVLARLGLGNDGGHVYLAPAWGEPELLGEGEESDPRGGSPEVAVARHGDTWVALLSPGGWELAKAVERFPKLYTDRRNLGAARVLVARRQPAAVALIAGRRADETFEAFRERVRHLRVTDDEGWIRMGLEMAFVPGQRAMVNGKSLEPRSWPMLSGRFLSRAPDGGWTFEYGGIRHVLAAVGLCLAGLVLIPPRGCAPPPPATAPAPPSATSLASPSPGAGRSSARSSGSWRR